MSFNIAPVYGKQFIRFSETCEAATDTEAGGVGTVELGEFCVAAYATYAGANKVCPPGALLDFTGPAVGVNQSYIPTALSQPHTARQASVATSGLLLVDVDPEDAAPIAVNTQLKVNDFGQATSAIAGVEVTVEGTTPIVREYIQIGGRKMALVSFN